MRGLDHIGTPSACLNPRLSVSEALATMLGRMRRAVRHAFCAAVHGGHEFYRARTDTKLYQQCLLCGYETTGWTIDVSPKTRSVPILEAKQEPRRRPRAVA